MLLGFAGLRLALALLLGMVGSAAAEPAPSGRPPAALGTPSAQALAAAQPALAVGLVQPTFTFVNASFGSGAVGLRNSPGGGINISGVTGPIRRALIYWAVVTNGAPGAADSNIEFKQGLVGDHFITIRGSVIGTGPTPCWKGNTTTVFRGVIPTSIAPGNGVYLVRLKPGANGSTAGQSPWDASEPPLFEGATLVMIGRGTATVSVYERPLSGKTFFGDLTYSLKSPVSVSAATQVLLHNIGADGQIGVGVKEIAATAGEITTLNGRRIAGPGSPSGTSDWNGTIAAPLPQLWDNTTHDVTAAAKAGSSPTVLALSIKAPDDCVVPVANLLSVKLTP